MRASALHLPRAVGLAARRAPRLVGLAVDHHVALELAAVRAVGLIRLGGSDGAAVPRVGIGPRHRLARGRRLEGPLLRLRGQTLVALIERIAREAAEEGAPDDRARDGRAATARRCGDETAEGRAAQRTDGRLGIVLDGRAAGGA